jgi:hypothetical protein
MAHATGRWGSDGLRPSSPLGHAGVVRRRRKRAGRRPELTGEGRSTSARARAVGGVAEQGGVEFGGVLLLLPGSFRRRWRERRAGPRGDGVLRRAWKGEEGTDQLQDGQLGKKTGKGRGWRRRGRRGDLLLRTATTGAGLRRAAALSSALGTLRERLVGLERSGEGVREKWSVGGPFYRRREGVRRVGAAAMANQGARACVIRVGPW